MNQLKKQTNNKLLVIVGPTATGKTKLAVKLAAQCNGEIVSADSRQVYRGMDVGTGKDLWEFRIDPPASLREALRAGNLESRNKPKITIIPYHCIDVVSPKTEFNLAKYLKLAKKAVADIHARGKLPILVGGTGLYAQALVEGYVLSGVGPDKKLRAQLENMTVAQLQKKLKKLDPHFKEVSNKRYLIRYIEMLAKTKLKLEKLLVKKASGYDCLVLGITFPREVVNKRIDTRLVTRIKNEGLIEEVESLHKKGVSWQRLESFGLEYKFVSQYLQGKLPKDEMVEKLAIAIHQFAKRQLTWLRRWERERKICWVQSYGEAKKLVKKWL